ncbi:MAG: rRNA pseudouridine synthase [Chloroflexaceae bacterium]|nr:rRNA pseudouridine synthase [Chloroflexaceae bacterium]
MTAERLHKVLARAGVASRRACEQLIADGRVIVNGQVVREAGTSADLSRDCVLVDGERIRPLGQWRCLMLYKPVGVVSTAQDTHGRPTVIDLVDIPERVFPIGRLDLNSEGLLLLTNDGALTHQLTHPRFSIEKEYHVLLDRIPDAAALQQWRHGVLLEGQMTRSAQVESLVRPDADTWLSIVLREGRKRQIRAVAEQLGYRVQRLIRVREGDLHLGDLTPGAWRWLTAEEVADLRRHESNAANT